MKVAYLGPEKTFTETAAKELFPKGEFIPLKHIKRVVLAVENGEVDFGVVPVENIYNGKVIHTLDALTKYSSVTRIVREVSMPVVHCFGALKNRREIREVYSKDQALDQCDDWLDDHYPDADPIAVSSTGEAVKRILREGLIHAGAIASKDGLNELEMLAEDICPNNKTRFFALGKNQTEQTGDDKTLVSFHPYEKDKAGVLYHCLSPMELFGINLGDILSRPDRKITQRGFNFFIELDGHEKDTHVKLSLQILKAYLDPENKYPDAVRVFGSYPNCHWT